MRKYTQSTLVNYRLAAWFLAIFIIATGCSNIPDRQSKKPYKIDEHLRIALAVTDISVGDNRLAFGIIDRGIGPVQNELINLEIFFLDGPNPEKVAGESSTRFRSWPSTQGGVYTSNMNFPHPGSWGVVATIVGKEGSYRRASTRLNVTKHPTAPAIGQAAPLSLTKTATTGDELAKITSAINPHPPLYKISAADAVKSGKPSVILFATPAFCKTATCGPQLEILTSLQMELGNKVNFVHVEIYDNPDEIRGDITKGIISDEVRKWNLPSEPWTFLISSDGIISARFEGLATSQEIKEALHPIMN